MVPLDYQTLRRVKTACASLQSRAGLGTGYLVEPLRIATCAHVVRGLAKGSKVTAKFTEGDRAGVQATFLELNEQTDTAILELEATPSGVEPLRLISGEPSQRDCLAYGFPAFADGLGVPLTGVVMDPDARIPGDMRGLAIYSQILGSHPPESVGGFSGSPVLIEGRVVGHLSSVLGSDERLKQPHLGYAFAVPANGVLALLGRPVVEPVREGAATPEAQIVRLSTAFNTLQYCASGAEVRRLLEAAEQAGTLTQELRTYAAQMLVGLVLPDEALKVLGDLDGQRAREVRALALSLGGEHAAAEGLVRTLPASAEVLGIQGGILKRRWLATRNTSYLRAAFETYFEAYTAFRDHYPGINASACGLYLKQRDLSRKIAKEIIVQLADKQPRDKWEEASLAEAYLLVEQLDDARLHYRAACRAEPGRTREIAVMSTQARRNLKSLGRDPKELEDAFPPARRAVAFTGHRPGARLPTDRLDELRQRIEEVLDDHEVQFGFCSAAAGSDLLFIESLLDRGADVTVFLPVPRARFEEDSVGPDPIWRERFHRALARLGAGRIVDLPQAVIGSPGEASAFVACNEAVQEAARRQASLLGEAPILIAVVAADAEQEKVAPGGTAHAIRMWIEHGGRDVIRIDPLA